MPEIIIELEQIADSTASRARIRDHEIIMDRPETKGGGNQGPMGGEMLVAGLGGCFTSNVIAALNGRGLSWDNLHVTVRGSLEGAPPRFTRMAVIVRCAGVEHAQMKKILSVAERGCIAANTLKPCLEISITYHDQDE